MTIDKFNDVQISEESSSVFLFVSLDQVLDILIRYNETRLSILGSVCSTK